MRINKRDNINWTKIIAWLVIGLVTYTIWFKMVPGAVEYIASVTN
jgi:hypothetical protein